MSSTPAKRIAIIGAGPAGATAIDAFAQEQTFDIVRVLERREAPDGYCQFIVGFKTLHHTQTLQIQTGLAIRTTVDATSEVPEKLPAQRPKQTYVHYNETSMYPYLETNVDASIMGFSQEPISVECSDISIARHGTDTPFRPWQTIQRYVQSLVDRKGYQDFVSYSTTVELVGKVNGEWQVDLRKSGGGSDYWWKEYFDAVVVANGHYSVLYIPEIKGLQDFETRSLGSLIYTKAYRSRDAYRGKRIVVVGASVFGADVAVDLLGVAKHPVVAAVKGHRPNLYFGDRAFQHPDILQKPSISHIKGRTAHSIDGSSVEDVDAFVVGTGYSWSLPFIPHIPIRYNRVPDLYQHIFHLSDPTLVFIGAVAAGLAFKVYEWQSVLAARVLADRAQLPPLVDKQKWEQDKIAKKGDGVPFTAIYPGSEEYFETLRNLAGEPGEGQPGRRLPPFDTNWPSIFLQGHQRRIEMWKKANQEAWKRKEGAQEILAKL